MRRLAVLLQTVLLAACPACHPNDDGPPPSDPVGDTDADGDTDTGGGPDTDGDTDTASDTDVSLPLGAACDPDTSDCGEGAACCTACCASDATPMCTALDVYGGCPLPDVTVDADRLASDVFLTEEAFEADDCALLEGCVDAPGWRRLLRFTTTTPNIGTADLIVGDPTADPERFGWSECHSHYHLDGYVEYALLDGAGSPVATGRKQAFCLRDDEPLHAGGPPKYHCGIQGISVGWADVYVGWLDCQWVDVTEVPAGVYTLRLTLDPDGLFRELDVANNVVTVPVTVPPADSDVLASCDPVAFGEDRDCGWAVAETFSCSPGAEVTYGCDGACTGGCEGDPVLRLCDVSVPACTAIEALGSNDDAPCGSACSSLTVTCPESGGIQALGAAWASDETASCEVVGS